MLHSNRRRRPTSQDAETLISETIDRPNPSPCVTIGYRPRPGQWRMVVSTVYDWSCCDEPLLTFFAVDEARALRIAEIVTEFQSLQSRIAEYSPNHSPDEYFEEGYEILRQCRAEAQAVLVAPYPTEPSDVSSVSDDSEKRQLQR